MPPGTEPDLQALNNPYVAAREQQAVLPPPSSSEFARQPSFVGRPHLAMSRTFENQSIDPALLDNSLPRKEPSSHNYPRRAQANKSLGSDESSEDSSSASGETTSRAGDGIETEHEEVEGWGATNSRQRAHPGMFHSTT